MVRGPAPPDGSDQSSSLISGELSREVAKKGGPANEVAGTLAPVSDAVHAGINSPRLREAYQGPQAAVLQLAETHEDGGIERKNSAEIFSPKPQPLEHQEMYGTSNRAAWLRKVRSVFCCFAPTDGDPYYQPTPEPACNTGDTDNSERKSLAVARPPTPPEGYKSSVIGPVRQEDRGKKTLVLDLDETLVHSSFKPVDDADYIIPVDIDGEMVDVYVMKRPWLEHFMQTVSSRFEIIVFTASLRKYADPLLDLLDGSNVVRWRLFREACTPYEGNFVKDLNRLGRDLDQTIIIDNSPLSYIFQPSNAIPIGAFMGEKDDQELLEMVPLLLDLEGVEDVREYLAQKEDGFSRHVLSNGISLVPLGHGVGSEVVCESS